MSNLMKLEFEALDVTDKNYLRWTLDAETHLRANGLLKTIDESLESSDQEKTKALIFIRHHIHQSLKDEYIITKDPADLWKNLKSRYDHQKYVVLPKARFEWLHLRFQDFKTVNEYNSAVFRITSKLILCGDKITDADMIEKTVSAFHAENLVLQQQYREKGFSKYSELILCLLVAEENNNLLMKNHESRPTGATPFPEVNVMSFDNSRGHRRTRGNKRRRGRGSYREHATGKRSFVQPNNDSNAIANKRGEYMQKRHKESICYRCGMDDHWLRACCTPKHFVDLYQESLKNKGKRVETNFIDDDEDDDSNELRDDLKDGTYLDVADFLTHHEDGSGSGSQKE